MSNELDHYLPLYFAKVKTSEEMADRCAQNIEALKAQPDHRGFAAGEVWYWAENWAAEFCPPEFLDRWGRDPKSVEHLVAKLEALEAYIRHGAMPGAAGGQALPTYLGNGRVRTGAETVTLAAQEGHVLEALVDAGALSKADLEERSGYADAVKILRRIRNKYPALSEAIIMPGRPHSGGYRTTIRRAK